MVVVGPRLRRLLVVVLLLFAVLTVNSAYLGAVTLLEWLTGDVVQDYFYQTMFLAHLALGLVIVLPVLAYAAIHVRNAHAHPNRRAEVQNLNLHLELHSTRPVLFPTHSISRVHVLRYNPCATSTLFYIRESLLEELR